MRTLGLTLAAVLVAGAAVAKVFLTQEEALSLAFPGCAVESRTVYLTTSQLERARSLAGVEIESALVRPYVARCDPGATAAAGAATAGGTAYFDSHRVRTLAETLMVVVDPSGAIRRVEILAFREPEDYIPRANWYGQFPGRALDADLRLKGAIRGVTGATLTARATTDAVRRVLALHAVVAEETSE